MVLLAQRCDLHVPKQCVLLPSIEPQSQCNLVCVVLQGADVKKWEV